MKQWMKNGLTYALAFLCLAAGLTWTVRAKERTVGEAYRSAQETLRATELTQVITELEFGIRYGKALDNYYNMDGMLQSVLRSSPYVEGAYIISRDNALLYWAGEPMPHPEQLTVLHNVDGALYASSEQGDAAFMFMDIAGSDGETAGTLVVLLNDGYMNRLIQSYLRQGRAQSWVILGEMLLLFVILHTRLSRAGKKRLSALALAVLLAAVTLAAQAVDMGIEAVKLSDKLETLTSQSVQKIAQVLQQQVENVMDKGVHVDDLYDIYGWLDDIDEKLDMVARLDFTAEGRVRAVMDEEYLGGRTRAALWSLAAQFLAQAAACAALCGLTALAVRRAAALRHRKEGTSHAAA